MRSRNNLMAAALIAACSLPGLAGGAEVLPMMGGFRPPLPNPRRSAPGKGRRSQAYYSAEQFRRRGGNPAGSKLAKKAMRGTLTIVGIR